MRQFFGHECGLETHLMRPVDETSTARERENTAMVQRLRTIIAASVVTILMLSTLTFAAEIVGTVSAVDEKGMATIKLTDGKELQVQMSGVQPGDKVDCHAKGGKMSCHKLGPKHK
jgi:hypothetical protein